MKVFSTLLKLGAGFVGGYAVAKIPRARMRPALKQVVRASVAVQSKVKKAVATATEETEDILAELRAEEVARTHANDKAANDNVQTDAPKGEAGFRPIVKDAVRFTKAAGVNISKAASGVADDLRTIATEVQAESSLN